MCFTISYIIHFLFVTVFRKMNKNVLVEFNRYVEKCFQNFAEVVVLNDINQPNVSRRLIYCHALERLVLQNLTCRWSHCGHC